MPGYRRIAPLIGPALLRPKNNCLFELEDGSGYIDLEVGSGPGSLALETCNQPATNTFLIELEDSSGQILLENNQGFIELEVGP